MGAQNAKAEGPSKKDKRRQLITNYAAGNAVSNSSQGSSIIRSASSSEDGWSVNAAAAAAAAAAAGAGGSTLAPNQAADATLAAQAAPYPAGSLAERDTLVAMYDFSATAESQLSIRRGEQLLFRALNIAGGGHWMEVDNPATGRRGWVPSSYVAPPANLHLFAWYHGQVGRRTAEYLLSSGINGSYLVRDSESEQGQMSISVRFNSKVFHYRISCCGKDEAAGSAAMYFVTAEHSFPTVCQLVQHHSQRADGLMCTLLYPAPKRMRSAWHTGRGQHEDVWEVDRTELMLHQKLGAGHYGDVYQAVWKRWGNRTVAVKTVREEMISKVNDFLAEAQVMKRMRHENLVQLMGVCTREPPHYIVTEYMPHGNLLDFLRNRRAELQPFVLLYMASQVASGMAYMEKRCFVHRDLAARNCLVGDGWVVKVADFGLTRCLDGDSPYVARQGAKFPIKWTAPESLAFNRFDSRSDVWAFGVLLWEIATYGCAPYPAIELTQVYPFLERGYRMDKPLGCPEAVYELMRLCWLWEPERRPTFAQLHSDLKALCDQGCLQQQQQQMNPGDDGLAAVPSWAASSLASQPAAEAAAAASSSCSSSTTAAGHHPSSAPTRRRRGGGSGGSSGGGPSLPAGGAQQQTAIITCPGKRSTGTATTSTAAQKTTSHQHQQQLHHQAAAVLVAHTRSVSTPADAAAAPSSSVASVNNNSNGRSGSSSNSRQRHQRRHKAAAAASTDEDNDTGSSESNTSSRESLRRLETPHHSMAAGAQLPPVSSSPPIGMRRAASQQHQQQHLVVMQLRQSFTEDLTAAAAANHHHNHQLQNLLHLPQQQQQQQQRKSWSAMTSTGATATTASSATATTLGEGPRGRQQQQQQHRAKQQQQQQQLQLREQRHINRQQQLHRASSSASLSSSSSTTSPAAGRERQHHHQLHQPQQQQQPQQPQQPPPSREEALASVNELICGCDFLLGLFPLTPPDVHDLCDQADVGLRLVAAFAAASAGEDDSRQRGRLLLERVVVVGAAADAASLPARLAAFRQCGAAAPDDASVPPALEALRADFTELQQLLKR